MDIVKISAHVESDAVDDLTRCVIDELELDMLKVLANEHTRAEILDVASAESGFLVSGSKRIEEAKC